jgi:hypothetical protein
MITDIDAFIEELKSSAVEIAAKYGATPYECDYLAGAIQNLEHEFTETEEED